MLGFRLPVGDGAALKQALYERHRIEVPVVETKDGWVMRVSIQGYNDDRDVDALLAALDDLL
jgi:selenocysteine lyase/cysteine desulfurase